jgi:predicted transcriptional regulator
MVQTATTYRLDRFAKEGLAKLSRLLHTSHNKLVNQAVREFVLRRTRQLEVDLESTLADLRAYQARDPDFEESIAKFVAAEVALEEDPTEGTVVVEDDTDDALSGGGPAHSAVREVLNG